MRQEFASKLIRFRWWRGATGVICQKMKKCCTAWPDFENCATLHFSLVNRSGLQMELISYSNFAIITSFVVTELRRDYVAAIKFQKNLITHTPIIITIQFFLNSQKQFYKQLVNPKLLRLECFFIFLFFIIQLHTRSTSSKLNLLHWCHSKRQIIMIIWRLID